MKNITTIFTLILIFVFNNFGQSKDWISTDEKFSPSGKIKTSNVENEVSKEESGILNGVRYEFFYAKGMGRFVGKHGGTLDNNEYIDNWIVGCQKDAIDDSKRCFMAMHDLSISIFDENTYVISVGRKQAYDSSIAIRVDDNQAFQKKGKFIFTGEESTKIIEQLKKGKNVTTRFYPAFEDSRNDGTFELYGFNEAFQYINWAFSKIK